MCRLESDVPPVPPHINLPPEKPIDAETLSSKRKHLGFVWATVIVGSILLTCTIIVVVVGLDIQHKQKTNEPVAMALANKVKIISREEWNGADTNGEIPELKDVKYVIMCHTAGRFCFTKSKCTSVVKWIQNNFITTKKYPDIIYNFVLGGDGHIYEGLGWHKQNNIIKNSISIGIIGNYIYDMLTEEMIEKIKIFLDESVQNGLLDKNYFLIPHNQTKNTLSPGRNVYREIKNWTHYSSDYIFS